MGTSHVLYVYEDAIRSKEVSPEFAQEVGRALVKLCLHPDHAMESEGSRRVTWEQVGHHGNALNWIDDPPSSEIRVYLWAGNTLQRLGDLDRERLLELKALVDTELASRT
jgi:hypothetical protein